MRKVSRHQVEETLRRPSDTGRLPDEPDKWDFTRDLRTGSHPMLHVIAYRRGKRFKVKTVYFSERR